MKRFVISGRRPDAVSREQLRSFLHAAEAVLGYHGWHPAGPIRVRVLKVLRGGASGSWTGGREQLMRLYAYLDPEEMLTTVVHEYIHACRDFPDGTDEKVVSTLTARLKRDVYRLSRLLLDGTYRRAAYLAHARISYPTAGGDFYDPAQDAPIGVRTRYRRTR